MPSFIKIEARKAQREADLREQERLEKEEEERLAKEAEEARLEEAGGGEGGCSAPKSAEGGRSEGSGRGGEQ